MPDIDKLKPNDPRVERKETEVNGRTYSYLLGQPAEGQPLKGHIFLVHGFPDLAFGWRYQIPFLQSLGYAVLAPDMLGYGLTTTPPADDPVWSLKGMADDVAALSAAVFGEDIQIIIGGHDWGGGLVWRVALWHPGLLRGVFAVCTPYNVPSPAYIDLKTLVESGKLPTFRYQLQFISGEIEERLTSPDDIRRFLLSIYGARTDDDKREPTFTTEQGVIFDRLPRSSPLVPTITADELDEYVRAYTQEGASGLAGPLRWYHIRKRTFEEERPLAAKNPFKVATPSLLITAARDHALPPVMAKGMEKHFEDLETKMVEASHWAMWQAPDRVNAILRDWLAQKFEGNAAGAADSSL